MNNDKQLWVLSGGNGAGKTTFYNTQLAPLGLPFINADILAKQLYGDEAEAKSYDAAKIAETMRIQLIQQERTFCFETVFSHPSKIDFIAHAKSKGYEIILVYIHLSQIELNLARIAQRVSEGGHTVPSEKVITRIPRVQKYIKQVLPLCDTSYLLDNSSLSQPFKQIAVIGNNKIQEIIKSPPTWAKSLLKDYLK